MNRQFTLIGQTFGTNYQLFKVRREDLLRGRGAPQGLIA
jgi:hypothetical protein